MLRCTSLFLAQAGRLRWCSDCVSYMRGFCRAGERAGIFTRPRPIADLIDRGHHGICIESAHMEPRPYYHRFAWAYDLLQPEPIATRIEFIVRELNARGVQPPMAVLDAGCGTGRYSAELADRGFTVMGVDRSPELIAIARNRRLALLGNSRYEVCDLLAFAPTTTYAAILCRGVLNDFTQDADRHLIFERFARWLQPSGVLIFDVRDWNGSASRFAKQAIVHRRVVLKDGSELSFESCTIPDPSTRELRIREKFEHQQGEKTIRTENDFSMRCWSRGDLEQILAAAFREVSVHPTYGESDLMWNDRLIVIATCGTPQNECESLPLV